MKNYQGHLIAANPANPVDGNENAVILIIANNNDTTVGLQINQLMDSPELGQICRNIGIEYDGKEPLFWGGQISQNKIHVIHSLDWQGLSTTKINDELGVTNDISVLAAISRNEGPEYFRCCVGYWIWEHGRFEQQVDPKNYPSKEIHQWETVPATMENVFSTIDKDQWRYILNESIKLQTAVWF